MIEVSEHEYPDARVKVRITIEHGIVSLVQASEPIDLTVIDLDMQDERELFDKHTGISFETPWF
jgi:hypothetical protein